MLTLRITDIEATSATLNQQKFATLNGGSVLNAGVLYTFVFGVRKEYSYNLMVDTMAIADYVVIEEITGAVS